MRPLDPIKVAIEKGNKVKAEVQMFVEDKPVGAKPEPVELIIGNENIIPALSDAFVGHKKGKETVKYK